MKYGDVESGRMSLNYVNLDDFPDSLYATELRKKSNRLAFPPGLEAEYLADHLRRIQPRARIWTAFAALLALGFTLAQWLEDGGWSGATLMHALVILPAAMAMAWLAWSEGHMHAYLRATRVLAPLLGAAVAVAVSLAVSRGDAQELANLVILLVACYFLMGLLFSSAMVAGAAIVTGFVAGALYHGVPDVLLLKCGLYLVMSAALGTAICREVERSYRKRFLEQSLINELVDRDGLTGLRNRRAFDEHVLRVWQQCLRGQNEMAFILIDVDYFKLYNDTYGHQAGDVALRKVADVVKEFARRPLDIAARYGGEEFVIIIYDISPAAVRDIAERLRAAVESLRIPNAASRCSDFVTASIGVSIIRPAIGRTPTGGLQLADEALYQAKQAGRNRCVIEGQAQYETLVTGSYRNPEPEKAHG